MLKTALGAAYDYEKWGTPFRAGGRYFYRRNAGLKNQPVLYCRPSLDAPPAVVLDPNLLKADGTVSLQEYSVSHDGRLLAAAFSTGGSDWRTVRVFAVGEDCQGTPMADALAHVKFTELSWTRDGLGFFYSRYDPPKGGTTGTSNQADSVQQLWYHVVGTDQVSGGRGWDEGRGPPPPTAPPTRAPLDPPFPSLPTRTSSPPPPPPTSSPPPRRATACTSSCPRNRRRPRRSRACSRPSWRRCPKTRRPGRST